MYAEPITDRIERLLKRREDLAKLFKLEWTDQAIAGYFNSDKITVRRVRKLWTAGLLHDKETGSSAAGPRRAGAAPLPWVGLRQPGCSSQG